MNRASFLKRFGLGLAVVTVDPRQLIRAPANPIADVRAAATVMRANGGLCAPVTLFCTYGYQGAGTEVASLLPAFSADRGGIRYHTPGSLSTASSA